MIALSTNTPSTSSNVSIVVAGGTLKDTTASNSPSNTGAVSIIALAASKFTVDAGATVNFNDHSVRLLSNPARGANLAGAGQILLGTSPSTELRLRETNFSGAISGAGTVTVLSSATPHILAGTNAYSGGTTINAGASLQLGNGGAAGSIAGDVVDNGVFAFNRSDTYTFAGIISGSGAVNQIGPGTTVLTATHGYAGGTAVMAGTLNVAGGIGAVSVSGGTLVSSGIVGAVAVSNGGTLSGTGKTGSVNITSSGIFSPGANSGTGTLNVQGNLTLAAGAVTSDHITPTANSSAIVAGTASIGGALVANAVPGTYSTSQRYTIIDAAGGVSGTYASFSTPGLPGYVKGRLGYDANAVYLYLDANVLASLLATDATGNEKNVAVGIDAAIKGGANLSPGFQALFSLSGPALTSALNQVSGQVANSPSQASGQSFAPFLAMLTQTGGNGPAANFAPQASYSVSDAPGPAQASGEIRVWASAFGGRAGISADTVSGALGTDSSIAGLAGGTEKQFGDDLLVGASFAAGHGTFSSGDGKGSSDDVMIALYGRHVLFARGYLAAALGYGWHDIATRHAVTVSGTDVLAAQFDAHDFGGRAEGGYDFALGPGIFTPFAAFTAQNFHAPAYGETAVSGASTFALSYAANDTGISHSELGAHYRRAFATADGMVIHLDTTAAWDHELDNDPLVQAVFQSLPGSNFILQGARSAADMALLGAGLRIQKDDRLSFGVRGDARVGTGTTILSGMFDLSATW